MKPQREPRSSREGYRGIDRYRAFGQPARVLKLSSEGDILLRGSQELRGDTSPSVVSWERYGLDRKRGEDMELPRELEAIRHKKIWVCYPMIWAPGGHDGQGAYRKPPINPYTLKNANPTGSSTWSDFDTANSRIRETAYFTDKDGNVIECRIHGVGIALYNSGVFGLDLDSVVRIGNDGQRFMTREAREIIDELNTYVEVSPSGTGLHVLCLGKLDIPDIRYSVSGKRSISDPKFRHSGKFEIYKSGKYLTVTGDKVGSRALADCTESFKATYRKHFVVPTGDSSLSVVSSDKPTVSGSYSGSDSAFTRERWLEDVKRLRDEDILQGIFKSGRLGAKVEALFDGDMSAYNNGASEADQALVTYLYCFTDDEALTMRLFEKSALCREKWTSRRDYRERTLRRAKSNYYPLTGHITFTDEEKKAYAQQKEAEEFKDLQGQVSRMMEREKRKRQGYGQYRYNSGRGTQYGRRKI